MANPEQRERFYSGCGGRGWMLAGLGYGLEVKGVVVNSELAMLRCSWKWKPSFGLGERERDLGWGRRLPFSGCAIGHCGAPFKPPPPARHRNGYSTSSDNVISFILFCFIFLRA